MVSGLNIHMDENGVRKEGLSDATRDGVTIDGSARQTQICNKMEHSTGPMSACDILLNVDCMSHR